MLFICVWSKIRLTFKNIRDQFCCNAPLVRLLSNTPTAIFPFRSLELWGYERKLEDWKIPLKTNIHLLLFWKKSISSMRWGVQRKACWFTGVQFFTVTGSPIFRNLYLYRLYGLGFIFIRCATCSVSHKGRTIQKSSPWQNFLELYHVCRSKNDYCVAVAIHKCCFRPHIPEWCQRYRSHFVGLCYQLDWVDSLLI